ncbi:hypothetical protein JP0090_12920 [Helicobacter pylori]|nr:hypothetical protein JP0090_12920 [Helicobacter pylori]
MWFMPCVRLEPVYESKDDYEFSDSLLYALGAMKQSRNSRNLRVTWNGLRAFMKKAMALL